MKVLVLRTVDKDRKAHGGFVWPETGPVECPDWDPEPRCGSGLHGYLRGEGDAQFIRWDGLWQVVEVEEADIVQLGGKIKFPRATVLYTGDRKTATDMIKARHADAAVIGSTATAGNSGTATAGDLGTATAGNSGTATAGEGGVIVLKYWDDLKSKYRVVVGEIGEGGLEPGKKYRLNDKREFEEVK